MERINSLFTFGKNRAAEALSKILLVKQTSFRHDSVQPQPEFQWKPAHSCLLFSKNLKY